MKILVTGANGQLGSELRLLSNKNLKYFWVFTDLEELNLADSDKLYENLTKIAPNYIINCAAYTDVDKAETEFELANKINCDAVDIISRWTNDNNCKLIHISTDYVFDGHSKIPIDENQSTNPLNNYGLTKRNGEINCLKNDVKSIVIRTSWVFSSFGKNFVKTMFSAMESNSEINVIYDQVGSPTYARDLAGAIIIIINSKCHSPGLFHYSNHGEVSWYDFAKSIKKICGYKTKINKISSKNYGSKVKRPKYSLLEKTKIKQKYNIDIANFEESLKDCIKIIKDEK